MSSAGHDLRLADGRFGKRTRDAIRHWQGSRGEAVTGYLTKEQSEALVALGERARSLGTPFQECLECPELVVVPSGSFMMGSPESEAGRRDREGPRHRVTIGRPFAVGVKEVTVGEFGRFVSETGHSMGDSCWTYEDDEWKKRTGRHWKRPGYSQTDSHPWYV